MMQSFNALRKTAAVWRRRVYISHLEVQRDEPLRGRPLVAGLFSAPSGIGTGARALLAGFQALGLEPAAADLTPVLAPDQVKLDVDWLSSLPEDDSIGPVVIHVNPAEVPFALHVLRHADLSKRYRIGYWAWEAERVPSFWPREATYFHELWAPSCFTRNAISTSVSSLPVHAVGYALNPEGVSSDAMGAWRRRLEVADAVLVLAAFDQRSSINRKNPEGIVDAFRRAFPERHDVRLVMKVSNWGWRPELDQRVSELVAPDPRITILKDHLDEASINALTASADVFLSPHRGEGFGLMLANSLLHGREVVMTNWSGNADFAHLPGAWTIDVTLRDAEDDTGIYDGDIGRWAEPDPQSAADQLRNAVNSFGQAGRRVKVTEAAQQYFSADAFLARTGESFQHYSERNRGAAS